MIISRTPFRISFFGGGTDFPGHYLHHGGTVLATAIDQYCYLSIHRLSAFFKHRFRASYAKTESVVRPEDFQHPLIRECLLYLRFSEGLEISHVADLPGRTGLGTSSSFTVGLLHALHAYRNEPVSPGQLAREAIEVERERVGDGGGHQDQFAAAFGGFVRITFCTDGQVDVMPLDLPDERWRALHEHLLLFYTGISASAASVVSAQTSQIGQNEFRLRRMHELTAEAEELLCSRNDIDGFGELLHQTWIEKKALANGVSNSTIDARYEAARRAGALGGKLLGSGGRGFLLFFARPAYHARIEEALAPLLRVRFQFSPEGSRIIFRSTT